MKQRQQFFEALTRITAAINSKLELEEVLSLLCREVVSIFGIAGSAIYIFDVDTFGLDLKASDGIDTTGLEKFALQETSNLLVNSFFTGKPAIANHSTDETPQHYFERGFNSVLVMPLIRDETGLGILLLGSREAVSFTDEDLERARMLADHAAIAVRNAILFEKERHKSQQLEVAMQEAHHRIKNNLQTVAVLLSLQMDSCDIPEARVMLGDSIARINAISLVHELLSQDSDIRLIDCRQLLGRLMHQVSSATNAAGRNISIDLDSQRIFISSKRATTLALIAQELVANALEHGMAGKAEGTVEVTLHKAGSTVIFSVKDNGIGLPEGFDSRVDGRIGLEVVHTLAEKELSGKLEFRRCRPGLQVTLNFEDAGIAVDD